MHISICSCDTCTACLVAFAAAAAAATCSNCDLETLADSQIGNFNNPGLSRKALTAVAAV